MKFNKIKLFILYKLVIVMNMLEKWKSLKVYVVDDDSAIRRSLQSMLESVGYDIELYADGAAFLERARSDMFGCIILDVRMPGPSGLEVQRRLVERGVKCPVIFVTAHGDIAMAVQAMKAQAVEFLTKPFREQDLLDAIGRGMELETQRSAENKLKEGDRKRLESLSPKELKIFQLMRQGLIGKQIAHRLGISEATVKVHRRGIMQKLQLSTTSQVILLYGSTSPTDAESSHV